MTGPESRTADALAEWRRLLGQWRIPDEILAQAPESPWTLPAGLFARRADFQVAKRQAITLARAEEALQPRGRLLDVGAGAGAASLPLAEWTDHLVGVDSDPAMLEQLRRRAEGLGLEFSEVQGTWPEVAAATPRCDVTVCSHVLYNVPELGPFVTALAEHSRRRVVVEITASHPAGTINPLWLRFHGIQRPTRPTWEDALRALRAAGIEPVVEHQAQPRGRPQADTLEELVTWTRRRLCLSPERDDEVEQAMIDELGIDPGEPESWNVRPPGLVVFWWDSA